MSYLLPILAVLMAFVVGRRHGKQVGRREAEDRGILYVEYHPGREEIFRTRWIHDSDDTRYRFETDQN